MSGEARIEQLSALLDGELPPPAAAELTAHLAACPDCARRLAELGALRAALADSVPEEAVSAAFLARVTGALDEAISAGTDEARVVRFRPRVLRSNLVSLAAGAAVAAMLTLALLPRHDNMKDLMAVRDAALRGAIMEVRDRVPTPMVPDFRLSAARGDVIAGHQAQVLVYAPAGEARAGQTVTLCIWKANGEPAHGVRQASYRGMAISYWNDGTHEFWAASSGPASDLRMFVREVRDERM